MAAAPVDKKATRTEPRGCLCPTCERQQADVADLCRCPDIPLEQIASAVSDPDAKTGIIRDVGGVIAQYALHESEREWQTTGDVYSRFVGTPRNRRTAKEWIMAELLEWEEYARGAGNAGDDTWVHSNRIYCELGKVLTRENERVQIRAARDNLSVLLRELEALGLVRSRIVPATNKSDASQ